MEEELESALELAPRKEYATAAALAFQTDVGAEANDSPVGHSARMWLPEPHHITHGKRNRLRARHLLRRVFRAKDNAARLHQAGDAHAAS